MKNHPKIEIMLQKAIDFLRKTPGFTGNYSSYIFPLFLLLWFSYLNNKEKSKAIEKPVKNFSSSHVYDLIALRDMSDSCSDEINNLLLSIENFIPQLRGILVNSDSSQWDKISDEALQKLIKIISSIDFNQFDIDNIDLLREVCQDVVCYGLNEGRFNTNYFIPRDVSKLIVRLLKFNGLARIYDPECGSGSLLIEAARYFAEQGLAIDQAEFWGETDNSELRVIASISLLLSGVKHFMILPKYFEGNLEAEKAIAQKFDVIITNPPFGVKNWHEARLIDQQDSLHIFKYGMPPKNSDDYVFIQRVLHDLTPQGQAVMLVPHGVLFREGVEGEIRKGIVKDDLIEAIIGLPSNLFDTTKIATAIIIFNKNKPENMRDKILFIDGSQEYIPTRKRYSLDDKIIARVSCTYSGFLEEAGYSRIVSHGEIAEYGYTLSVKSYIVPRRSEVKIDDDLQVQKIQELEFRRSELEFQMNRCLNALDIKNI